MKYTVLIPARLASTRLPNKPLADIHGAPMIVRVAQRVRSGLSKDVRIVVAADHQSILDQCYLHNVDALLTRTDHASGSDRLAEACDLLSINDSEVVVNVQGDEPLIDPELVENVAKILESHPEASMGTAAHAISDIDEFRNPNVVKVVTNKFGLAMYFSRAPIPWDRNNSGANGAALPTPSPLRHIGIYSYRAGLLRAFPTLSHAPVEFTESLEQLRPMWHGHRIAVHISPKSPGPGVDTMEDLEKVRELFTRTSM